MEGSSSPKGFPFPWEETANDRLKAHWTARVSWSTVAAVLVHGALFVVWPAQARQALETENEFEAVQLEWITFERSSPADQAQAPLGLPVLDDSDSLRVEEDRVGTPDGEGDRFASLDQVFEDRLLSSSAPEPTLAEPAPEVDDDARSGEEASGDGDAFGGEADATAGLPEWLGASPMELDRLAEVRPELAVIAPSAWVLIRNPNEVEDFIQRSYRRGDLPRSADGSVSVALWIDGRGRVEWAEVSESSGRDDMDELALELFSEVALFRPARTDGSPTPRSVVFSVQFPWVANF